MKSCLLLFILVVTNRLVAQFNPDHFVNVTDYYLDPHAMGHGDIDGDGDLDLVAMSANWLHVYWIENVEDGIYGGHRVIFEPLAQTDDVELIDIENDGDLDILVSYPSFGWICMHENLGSGTYGPMQIMNDGVHAIAEINEMAIVDVDNDGFMDVVAATDINSTDNILCWFENDGNGGFVLGAHIIADNLYLPKDLLCEDLDNDSVIEIAIEQDGGQLDHQYDIYTYNGSGGFVQDSIEDAFLQGVYPAGRFHDINNDGYSDFVFVSNDLRWKENDGSGSFLTSSLLSAANSTSPTRIGDFNGDGNLDLFTMAPLDTLRVLYGDGTGSFSPPQIIPNSYNTYAYGGVQILDADDDGFNDLVLYYDLPSGAELRLYRSDANGITEAEYISPTARPQQLESGDLDGDGLPDFVTVGDSVAKLVWYRNLGNSKMSVPIFLHNTNDIVRTIHIVDLDLDLDLDILYGTDAHLFWLENDGTGNFAAPVDINNSSGLFSFRDIDAGDIDSDGDLDIVVGTSELHALAWFENLGNSTFAASQEFLVGTIDAYHISIVDADDDGDLDVMAAFNGGNNDAIGYMVNDGAGNFFWLIQTAVTTTQLAGASAFQMADINTDGLPDILAGANGLVCWFENLGSGSYGPRQDLDITPIAIGDVEALDIDLDGDLDVLAADWIDDDITLYLNNGMATFNAGNIILEDIEEAYSIAPTDLDGDSDSDLIIGGSASIDILLNETVCNLPQPSFNLSFVWDTIQFTSTSNHVGNVLYNWDFGDGNSSTLPTPQHIYSSTGTYNICLEITDVCGTNSYCENINIDFVSIIEEASSPILIYPNPVKNIFKIESWMPIEQIVITDLNGKIVTFDQNGHTIELANASSGLYIAHIMAEDSEYHVRFIKE